jgi:hypothetical protein
MSDLFILIYSGEGGLNFTNQFLGGGVQAIKVWEPLAYTVRTNSVEQSPSRGADSGLDS